MRERLLIVDDDAVFCETLAEALQRRGFDVTTATSVERAVCLLDRDPPHCALIDLRIGEASGLVLVAHATAIDPPVRAVVLTGFASIATAVEAIKLGASHYLTKPVQVADIIAAMHRDDSGDSAVALAPKPPSVRRLEWEHIQRVLRAHNGNISATARALNMHRRTLQRKLAKFPVKR